MTVCRRASVSCAFLTVPCQTRKYIRTAGIDQQVFLANKIMQDIIIKNV